MSLFENIRQKKKELEAEIAKVGQDAFKEEFKKFFDEHPEVEGIRWTQYTPYFNDGEPCIFSVHDPYVKLFGDDTSGDYEDGWMDSYYLSYGYGKDRQTKNPELDEAVNDFWRKVCEKDVMLAVFDDGVQVTVTREGFEIEEYDHD